MRPLVVVEGNEALEGAIHGGAGGEVSTPEGDPPVFMEDSALESLDEAVGPAVTRLGARMADAQLRADSVEESLELAAAVGEHALELPSGLPVGRKQDPLEESGTVDGLHRRDDLGEGEGASRITGRDLPERAHALELADVEAVQADQIAGKVGLDVAGAAVTGPPEASAGTLGEKASGSCAVVLKDSQPLMTRPQAPRAEATDGRCWGPPEQRSGPAAPTAAADPTSARTRPCPRTACSS